MIDKIAASVAEALADVPDGATVPELVPIRIKDVELARLTDYPSKRTDFQSLSAQFNFSNGVARNHDLRLNSSLFSLQGHGKVDLVGNIIDYAMRVQPNILVFTNTKEMNVPLKITGALNAPTYALDFNALVKDKKTILEKQQVLKEQLSNQFNLFKTTP